MSTLDRYIARTFLSSYLILLLLGVGVYIFSDVVVNLDEYTGEPGLTLAGALAKMLDYHGHRLPLYFHQLGGVMMAIAGAFTFAMMLRNNELAPLVAAGVPLQRLAVPVLLCSVGIVGIWLVNSEAIMPGYAAQIARRYGDLDETGAAAVRCVRDDYNAILIAEELHARQGWLKGVYIIEPGPNRVPQYLIRADAARYDPARRTWVLERGGRLIMAGAFEPGQLGRAIRWEPLDEFRFALTPDQIVLRQSTQWAELMSIREMNQLLSAAHTLPNLPAVERSRDIRFYQPLIMWILVLLAVPFFLTREPENVLAAGGKALLLAGACYGVTFVAHSSATDAAYARLVAATPVLIFGPIAILNAANVKT